MDSLLQVIDEAENIQSILITPYLINDMHGVYELYYYEFELGVDDVTESHFIEYAVSNTLPQEIVANIRPKAIVSKNDKPFYMSALKNYLSAMKKMSFTEDIKHNDKLASAVLHYQLY